MFSNFNLKHLAICFILLIVVCIVVNVITGLNKATDDFEKKASTSTSQLFKFDH